MRDLNHILVGGQITGISFGGASVAQVIKMMELQNDDRVDTLTLMIGIEEMEAEQRKMVNPVTRGSPAGRVRSHVPQALVNHLVPLTTEANVVQPSSSSDVGERDWGPLKLPEADPWNRADPQGAAMEPSRSQPWGQHKADMAIKLSMKTLTCRADARRMLNGVDPTVSGLYRLAGVDWL